MSIAPSARPLSPATPTPKPADRVGAGPSAGAGQSPQPDPPSCSAFPIPHSAFTHKSLRPLFDQLASAGTQLDDMLQDLNLTQEETQQLLTSRKFHTHRQLRTELLSQQLQLVAQDHAQFALSRLVDLSNSRHSAIARLAATQILAYAGLTPPAPENPSLLSRLPASLEPAPPPPVPPTPKPAVCDGADPSVGEDHSPPNPLRFPLASVILALAILFLAAITASEHARNNLLIHAPSPAVACIVAPPQPFSPAKNSPPSAATTDKYAGWLTRRQIGANPRRMACMLNKDAIHRLLAAAEVDRDPYVVAEVAGALLMANAGDSFALGQYGRALASLHLFAAAQRAMAPGGEHGTGAIVPWSSRARRFAANLRVLDARDPEGAAAVRAAADAGAELGAYELHQCADGNFQVLDTRMPLFTGWLGGLADHKAAAARWRFDPAQTPFPAPMAFDGLGFGWLFLHMLKTTQNSYLDYNCAMYVLSGDPEAIAMVFHMHDLQEVIAQPRTRWFVRNTRPQALADLLRALRENRTWTPPDQAVSCALRPAPGHTPADSGDFVVALRESLNEFAEIRRRRGDEIARAIASLYDGKKAGFWAKRFDDALSGRGEKLRILGLTSRYTTVLQHSMAEMKAAVESAFSSTCEMRIAIEPDAQSLEIPFPEIIADFKPDLLFQISRLRFENPQIPRAIPYLCWDQDNLPCMRDPRALADFSATTFIAGFGAGYGAIFQNWPLKNCIFCYPTGMTHAYKPEPLSDAEFSAQKSDVSYVSHASGSPEALRDSLVANWNGVPGIAPLCHAAAECVLAGARAGGGGRRWTSVGFRELIREQAAALNVPLTQRVEQELVVNLTSIADRAFRHQTLAWAARWCQDRGRTFRIWGKGWDAHPALSRFAAGPAAPGRGARTVYGASTINLQIIETGVLHSRLLDGWASGGFFLIRQALLPEEQAAEATHWRIAQLTQSEKIETIADVASRGSPELQRQWQLVADLYRHHDRHTPFAGFKIWQSLAPPQALISGLDRLMFNDEMEFRELADRYIGSEELRRQCLDEIRPILLRHFNYDARMRDFLSHIRHHLQGVS